MNIVNNFLKVNEYKNETLLPKRSRGLRFWLSLYKCDFPMLNAIARKAIGRYLPYCKNCSFSSGFNIFYGNIHGKNVSLNDTFFVDYANVYIGPGTSFSFQNMVLTSTHDLNDMRTVITKEVFITAPLD